MRMFIEQGPSSSVHVRLPLFEATTRIRIKLSPEAMNSVFAEKSTVSGSAGVRGRKYAHAPNR
jgi:hypothetical protein